jgi:HicB family
MSREQSVLDSAREISQSVENWADLSNALFDPENGLVARAYPTRAERERFIRTKEYRAIRGLIHATREQSGLVGGAMPSKSGKFVVRVPKSLHAALESEAQREGVSLNQLVVAKLAVQLSRLTAEADAN